MVGDDHVPGFRLKDDASRVQVRDLLAGQGWFDLRQYRLLGPDGAPLSVLALGIFLVALGAFWERFRARVLAALAPILPLDRLPPSTVGAHE